jgi:hypothetical protein
MAQHRDPLHTPLLGHAQYEAAIDAVLARANATIRIFDQALGSAYNSTRRTDLLRNFFLASRRNSLHIALHDTSTLDRACPRLLGLLRLYGHAISIHETRPAAKSVYDPFMIVDDCCFVHRFHFDEMRGLCVHDDPAATQPFVERFSEIWEESSAAVSATTLGL